MLTEYQLGFFARNGFLHIENLVSSDICAALVEKTWARLPARWERHDSQTWRGPVGDSCHDADIDIRRGHLKFQKGDLIDDPTVRDGFFNQTQLGLLARELIGAPLAPMRVRGLYCIVPVPAKVTIPTLGAPHIEAHPTQLVCLCYLEDVPPESGGLLVWPGSHREIYPTMSSRLEFSAQADHSEVFERWASRMPRQVPGRRGDVVIIHHRLLHAPSINRANKIRFGFLCDYHRKDFRELSALPPSSDIWEDWPAIRQLPEVIRNAGPDYRLKQRREAIAPQFLSSWRNKFSFSRKKHAPWRPPEKSADHIRQNDASILARSRRPGDVWISLSDNPSTFKENKLRPRGSSWSNTALSIMYDGAPIESTCYYDFISKVTSCEGAHDIAISGLDRDAWLRVIRIKLPFDQSEVLLKARLRPGPSQLNVLIPRSETTKLGRE